MQKLKFRAWNLINEEMIILENSGLQYFDFEGNYSLGFTVDAYAGFWAHENYSRASKEAKNFPIMQFVGLLDINENEIYENDIVDTVNHKNLEVVWNDDACRFEMRGRFELSNLIIPLTCDTILDLSVLVIGNIYNN